MAECRFFPECQRCNEVGDSWLPCAGGAGGTRCKGYEPMPDVKALMALADEMDDLVEAWGGKYPTNRVAAYARSIREACGEVEE